MEEFFRFIQQSERERNRLVQEARASYDSVFVPAAPISEQRNKAPIGLSCRSERGLNIPSRRPTQ
jgi:hypothetical protein